MIWRSTLQKQHYRHCHTAVGTYQTFAGPDTAYVYTFTPMFNTVTAPIEAFWEGGVYPADTGVTAPSVWAGDIVLRGGKITMSVFNPSASESVGFKLFVVKTIRNPDLSLFPNVTPEPREWDPSCTADFARKVGRVVHSREGTIRAVSAMSFNYRLGVQKIDQSEYRRDSSTLVCGNQYIIIYSLYNLHGVDAVSCTAAVSLNCSFSGDAFNV